MAIGDIDTASFPISLDAEGIASTAVTNQIAALFTPTNYDITTEIVHITGQNGIAKLVVLVIGVRKT